MLCICCECMLNNIEINILSWFVGDVFWWNIGNVENKCGVSIYGYS